jgi:transcriptional regulator with XRE-family HTH domain
VDEETFLRAIGTRIRQMRKRSGMSIEKLATAADLHPTYISAIELGKRNPSVGVIYRVALALGVEPTALFDRTHELTAPELRKQLKQRLEGAGLEELQGLSRLLDAIR